MKKGTKTIIRRIGKSKKSLTQDLDRKKLGGAVALLVAVVLFAWGFFGLDKKNERGVPGTEAEDCPAPVTVTTTEGTTIYQAPCKTVSYENPWTMSDGYVKSISSGGQLPSTQPYCARFFVAIKEGTHHDVEIKEKTQIPTITDDLKTCQDAAVDLRDSLQKKSPAPAVTPLPDSLNGGIQQVFRENFYYERFYPESVKVGSYIFYHDGHAFHKTHWRKEGLEVWWQNEDDRKSIINWCMTPDANGYTGCSWKYDKNYYDYFFGADNPAKIRYNFDAGIQKVCRIHIVPEDNSVLAFEVREKPVWDQNNAAKRGQVIRKCIEPTVANLCQHQDKFPYNFDYQSGGKSTGVVHKCEDITLKFTPKGEWFQNLGIDLINPDEFVSPPTDILACANREDCLAKATERDVLVGSKGKGVLKTPNNFVDLVQKSITSETAGLTCSGGVCKTSKSGSYLVSATIPATSYYGQCTDTGAGNLLFKLPGVDIPAITTKTSLKAENRPPNVLVDFTKPNKWNSIEVGKEKEIFCDATDPDACSDKISQFDWESTDEKGEPSNSISLWSQKDQSWKSSFSDVISPQSRANPLRNISKVKVSAKGKYVVGCNAWDDDGSDRAHGRGLGTFIIRGGTCEAGDVCIPECPYDPDCCSEPEYVTAHPQCNNYGDCSRNGVCNPKCPYDPDCCIDSAYYNSHVQCEEDCLDNGVCNPNCPYDHDCCKDPQYFNTHPQCGGVIGTDNLGVIDARCEFKLVSPKTTLVNTCQNPASVQFGVIPHVGNANVFDSIDLLKEKGYYYKWNCPPDGGSGTGSFRGDFVCQYKPGSYDKPTVSIVYKDKDGKEQVAKDPKGNEINCSPSPSDFSGVEIQARPECSTLLRKAGAGDSWASKITIKKGEEVEVKADYEDACKEDWKEKFAVPSGATQTGTKPYTKFKFDVATGRNVFTDVNVDLKKGTETVGCAAAKIEVIDSVNLGN